MRRLAFLPLLLLLPACGGSEDNAGPSEPEIEEEWTLVWSDEFDGGSLDLNK